MNSDTLATKGTISPPKNNIAALTAACGNGVSGVIIFALLPILLAVCADHLKLTAVQAGMLASTYFASYALITAISIFWILRVQWQAATYAAIGIMIVSIISIVILETYNATLIGLFFCGIGASILHALGYGIVSEMHDTDRGFAIKLIPTLITHGSPCLSARWRAPRVCSIASRVCHDIVDLEEGGS